MADMGENIEWRLSPQRQREELLLIQHRHDLELYAREISLAGISADTIEPSQRDKMNSLTYVTAHVETKRTPGETVETAQLRYVTPFNGSSGVIRHYLAFADVAYVYPDSSAWSPAVDFDIQQGSVVLRMIRELRLASHLGLIPDLADSLSDLRAQATVTPA